MGGEEVVQWRKRIYFTENYILVFPLLFFVPPFLFFGLSCSLSDEEKYGESKATWRKSGEGPNEKEREKEKAARFVIIHPRFFFCALTDLSTRILLVLS